MNGSQILFADTCGIFFFFSQMECVANVEKLGHSTCGSEFSDLLKNYWIWHHWLLISWSWQWRTAFHLTQGWALQLPVGPPAPTVLQPAPHAPSSNLPPLIVWGIQGAPTKHQALGKSLETGKHNTAPTLEELTNQHVNWWITVLPAKCRTEGMNTAVHRDSALRSWLEILWRSLSWMKMSDSGRWSVGMECRTFMWSPAHPLPAAQGDLSSQQLPFPSQGSAGGCPDWCWSVCNPPPRPSDTFLLSKHQRSLTLPGRTCLTNAHSPPVPSAQATPPFWGNWLPEGHSVIWALCFGTADIWRL